MKIKTAAGIALTAAAISLMLSLTNHYIHGAILDGSEGDVWESWQGIIRIISLSSLILQYLSIIVIAFALFKSAE